MLLFVYTTTTTPKSFVIFTSRYFKLSGNTTALSQSNCRNLSGSSIIIIISVIYYQKYVISRAVRREKFETILKHHEWYLCQISRTKHAIICLYYYLQRFFNFHMWVFQIKLKYHYSKPIKLQKFLM